MTDQSPDLIQRAAARLQARRADTVEQVVPVVFPENGRRPVPHTPRTIEADTRLPYRTNGEHAQINLSPTTLAANGIVLPGSRFSRTTEEFRSLKRHVLSLALRSGNGTEQKSRRIILVTSARQGEGKTFTATNLAMALSFEKDARVLLMDADAYRQSLMSYLGLSATSGWLDSMSQDANPDTHIIRTNLPGFSVLPTGKERAEIPELMSSRKMNQMLDDLVRADPGRFIVMDALPCLTSTEPAILAPLAGQTLFVVAAHQTSREDVESSLRLLNNSPNVSLVLNKAEPVLTEQFKGYGYDYAYQR